MDAQSFCWFCHDAAHIPNLDTLLSSEILLFPKSVLCYIQSCIINNYPVLPVKILNFWTGRTGHPGESGQGLHCLPLDFTVC